MVRNGTYYLNNRGDRWAVFKNGKRSTIELETVSGRKVKRSVEYYESLGNFAVAAISYKGKRIKVFGDEKLPD